MAASRRPLSIAIIAWINISIGGLGLVLIPLNWASITSGTAFAPELTVWFTVPWQFLGDAVYLVSGIGIMRARNWGRILDLVYGPVSLIVSGVLYHLSPVLLALAAVFYLVPAYFLLRPTASAFFRGVMHSPATVPMAGPIRYKPVGTIRRVLAVIFLSVAGLSIFAMVIVPALLTIEDPSTQLDFSIMVALLIVLAVFSGIPLLIGLLLWGRPRWRGVIGYILASVGGTYAFSALSFFAITADSQLRRAMAPPGSLDVVPFLRFISVSGAIAGPIFLAAGIGLVMLQNKRDKAKRNAATPDNPAS